MIVQIHSIPSYAVSAMNRGRDGEVKSMVFGGTRRTRISSQSLKRAFRRSEIFRQYVGDQISLRTRALPARAELILADRGLSAADMELILAFLRGLGGKGDAQANKDPQLTNQILIYSSQGEMDGIINQVAAQVPTLRALTQEREATKAKETGKAAPRAKTSTNVRLDPLSDLQLAADIALFGRMSTTEALTSADGAAHFAHAFSVNADHNDVDYFTAVDDVTGISGLLGERGFAAPVFYEYCAIDLDLLIKNLAGDKTGAVAAVLGLISAMMTVAPSGGQNSMMAHAPTEHMLIQISENKRAYTAANAFLTPVAATVERDGQYYPLPHTMADEAWYRLNAHIGRIEHKFAMTSSKVRFAEEVTQAAFIGEVEDLLHAAN